MNISYSRVINLCKMQGVGATSLYYYDLYLSNFRPTLRDYLLEMYTISKTVTVI